MKKGCKIPLIIVGAIIGAFILLIVLISIFVPQEEIQIAAKESKQDYERLKKSFRELEEAKKELKELENAERKKEMPKNSIKKIFGVAKKADDSGIVRIYYAETHCSIDYRFFPLGLFLKYEGELGVKLAPKIKKLYETDAQIMTLSIDVISPFQDKYGNMTWELVVSFEFPRYIFNRINWDRFLDNDLLKVAENVTWYRTP